MSQNPASSTPNSMPPSLRAAYQDALAVQNASNLSGVLHSWLQHQVAIRQEADRLGEGSDWLHAHPVNVLFASKVASLTGCDQPTRFHRAYDQARRAA